MVDGVMAVGLVEFERDLRSRVEGVRRDDVTRLVEGFSRLLLRGERGEELILDVRTLVFMRVLRWEEVEGDLARGLVVALEESFNSCSKSSP